MSENGKRNVPTCPAIPVRDSSNANVRTFHIQVITPLFGGGVKAGINDESYPIRTTAIRGHLRYWWRMTIGCKLSKDAMWQREEEVFGSTDFPSPLTVEVLRQPRIELVDPAYGDRFGPIAYANFPALAGDDDDKHDVAKDGIVFDLQLSWESESRLLTRRATQNAIRKKLRQPLLPEKIRTVDQDILTAFYAWCHYGGLGARTRRGCGAIYCEEIASNCPAIACRTFIGQATNNAIEAWENAVGIYQYFRQNPRGAKHNKTIITRNGPRILRDIPGRSHWPEADSIRDVTGCSLKPNPGVIVPPVPDDVNTHDHSTPVVPTHLLPAFPKAVMGLPVNFHFADSPNRNSPAQSNKDPKDVVLFPVLINPTTHHPEKMERMASPVITRPVLHNGRWCPAVIILEQHLPHGFKVRLEGKQALPGRTDLSRDINISHVVDPSLGCLKPMRGEANALDAFAKYLNDSINFTEVK